MAFSDEQRKKIETLTTEFLLEVRAAYLRAGASPLKHYDQIQARIRAAERSTATVEQWTTKVLSGLQLGPLSSSGSQALRDLCDAVRDLGGHGDFLALVRDEWGLLMATLRKLAEERRASREEMDPNTGEMKEANHGA